MGASLWGEGDENTQITKGWRAPSEGSRFCPQELSQEMGGGTGFQSMPKSLSHSLVSGPQGWSVSHHIQDLGPNSTPVVAHEESRKDAAL